METYMLPDYSSNLNNEVIANNDTDESNSSVFIILTVLSVLALSGVIAGIYINLNKRRDENINT